MKQYVALISTPIGRVPLLGVTMTDEREREITVADALRSMPRFGFEPSVENLPAYFAKVREVLG